MRRYARGGQFSVIKTPLCWSILGYQNQNREGKDGNALKTTIYIILLMLAGYFLVYVITPYDLEWHLNTSLSRLFVQLWPSFLFCFFLKVEGPDKEQLIHSAESNSAHKEYLLSVSNYKKPRLGSRER
jgi:hypothetical protein